MGYFNTNHERGAELRDSRRRTNQQEEKVLEVFGLANRPMAPHEVQSMGFGDTVPLTSVRRAMTVLTSEGLLEKTSSKIMGPYGKKVYLWRMRNECSHKQTSLGLFQ